MGLLRRARTTTTFSYTESYLARPGAYAIAPALSLYPGAQPLHDPNPLSDCAPDTWGRKVLLRAAGRRLDETSLLLGVNDYSRQGALRFWVDGVAQAAGTGVPVEAELTEILKVADKVDRGVADVPERDVRRLFHATGSLGGARPKANVRIGHQLWLAKFPRAQGDPWNIMAWEAALLDVMGRIGIECPPHQSRILTIGGERRTVLMLRRFDRTDAGVRIPYISAMTAVAARDGHGGDWLDLADWSRGHGADTEQMWRRATFGMLIGNRDNHLRNHGFLRRRRAWQLAPVFDVNPTPLGEGNAAQLTLSGHSEPDLAAFLDREVLENFDVSPDAAYRWLEGVRRHLPRAMERASAHGADAASLGFMRTRWDAADAALADAVS
ncbi:MAG: HipA domain-containing protein [Micrococcus sp.]|nr:HipA domain-containing protein [Micrococcus sp.]